MSSTTQVTTFADLYTDLLNRVRVDTAQTATVTQAKRYVNTALQDIALGFEYKMPWLERSATFLTHAPYTTGTVVTTDGSVTVTGTSTLWTTSNTYAQANARTTGRVTLGGGSDIYNITTVAASTLTLATKFVGTALSGGTYNYFEDEYSLASDFLRPIDFRSFTSAWNLPVISRAEFRRRFPRPNVSGRPYVCTLIDEAPGTTTAPIRRIQFYPYPSTTLIIPYNYVTANVAVSSAGVEATALSGDTDEPIFPLRYRHAIVLHALSQWYRDKKDDTRADSVNANYVDLMLRITQDMDIGTHVRAQIVPRSGVYNSRSPYRSHGGRHYSLNNSFDRFED